MTGLSFISVILPLKLEWEPCYCLPEDISPEEISVGDRVKVKFANRPYSGVVSATGITPDTAVSKIKPIEEVEKGLERILPQEIELWRRVADYYLCTIGEVYKAAYPVGKVNLEESHAAALERAAQRREKMLESMRQKVARLEERLRKKEDLIARTKEGTKAKGRYTEDAEKIRIELATAAEALTNAESAMAATPKEQNSEILPSKEVTLNVAQQNAYLKINEAFGEGKPVLLHGVTGSGKTEIYMKLAENALVKGKNVLYLVPEIALSRQLEDRLMEHFGQRLLVFHSAETAASRRSTAEAVRSGSGLIVLGTRSSLFLPHHDLGLIIVDEEHDSSYKQDSPAPRYNGRDTALMLSLIHGCSIILGSATPSLEEKYNCACGRHSLVELRERYHGTESADIEIIDTKAERRKRGMRGNFSIKLIEHIRKALSDGGQVMILRSRRAWAPALQCEECGDIPKCPRCNVSMSLHKSGGTERMTCHYCGHSQPFTGQCGKCGGALRSLGAGTQKIEDEAAALFPEARIARLDSDTAQNKTYETRTIREFSNGEIDILIGTQMLTKGFDFGGLSLVAVIAADTLLGIQDFRADEKALQILEQFRGRCGRRERGGLFVIQTSQPEHPVYRMMTTERNECPGIDLMQERKDFSFPPYTRIIELTFRDSNEGRAVKLAEDLAHVLRKSFDITGPYAPAVDRISDQHIRIIRISMKKDRHLSAHKKSVMKTVQEFEKARRYDGHITVNVDPA